jgi:SAM-dependent methyltransferase
VTISVGSESVGVPALDDGPAIQAMYARRVQNFRNGPLAQGWIGRRTQHARFGALVAVASDLSGASVLDIGCGLADLYAYLADGAASGPGDKASFCYTGVDFTASMLARARARFPDAHFLQADVTDPDADLPTADYVLASGLFSYMSEARMRAVIARMWTLARRAVAFNALSIYAPESNTPAGAGFFYADPAETFRFCRTLTPWVTLKHDYLPNDFCVHLRREPEP